jgi:hypothetical protein
MQGTSGQDSSAVTEQERALLLEIARCPNVGLCKQGEATAVCQKIVGVQPGDVSGFQVPEPWSGRLGTARILFVSSNPGISSEGQYPTWSWTDDEIIDFFTNRFGGGRKPWIIDGKRRLNQDGRHSGVRPYWNAAWRRAQEILGRPPSPGIDYALTEIVHCKSKKEQGVTQALTECAGRYLRRILRLTEAAVIVSVGKRVREHLTLEFGIDATRGLAGPLTIEGRDRLVVVLGHPAGSDFKTIPTCLSMDEQRRLRDWVLSR